MNSEERRLEIEKVAAECRRGLSPLLSAWIEMPETPRLGILCVGANGHDDILRNPEHGGVADLIHSSTTLLSTSLPSAWAISKPRGTIEKTDYKRKFDVEVHYSRSLRDDSGNSIFRKLEYLPSIVILLTHGSQGVNPYLEDVGRTGWVTAREAASELSSLPGMNLLVVLPCCFAATVSEPFVESDRIGSVFAPLDEEIGDRNVADMLRALGSELRKLDLFTISRGLSHAEA